jgi:hypothetical protein
MMGVFFGASMVALLTPYLRREMEDEQEKVRA